MLAPLGAREIRDAFLFHGDDGGVVVVVAGVRQALEDVDEDGVGFGDVEADVGDGVADELGEDGEDGAGEDLEGEGGGEGLLVS